MSRRVLVQTVQPVESGPIFGQGSDPTDLMKAQTYAHDHAVALARDCLVAGAAGPLAAGFPVVAQGGMTVQVGAGHIIDTSGRSYEMYDASEVEIELLPAHATLARIDLIYALLEVDAAAENAFRPFIRLRTQDELEEEPPVSPFAPTQLEVPTERHNRCTVMVKSSAAAANPAAPELAPNEVALYRVVIPPGLTEVNAVAIISLNSGLPSLVRVVEQLGTLAQQVTSLQATPREYTAGEIEIGPGAASYEGRSVQEFINEQVSDLGALVLPEILTPELPRNHADAGKLGAVGEVDAGTPVIDIPADRRIVFRSSSQVLSPDRFATALNARLISKAVGAGAEVLANTINFTLGAVVVDNTDAPSTLDLRSSQLSSPRFGPAMAGRGSHFIEIFGGTSNGAALSDWSTYDVLADTLTPRTITGDLPAAGLTPFMISCGVNSDHVLLFSGHPEGNWYKVNAATGVSTLLASGLPTAGSPINRIVGDLIQSDLIFLALENWGLGAPLGYWTFQPSTNTFTQLSVSGQTPVGPAPTDWKGCLYKQGQFVVVGVDPAAPSPEAGGSWIFDYPTLTWTKLSGGSLPDLAGTTFVFNGAGMAHVNGKVLLVGTTSDLAHEWMFELVPAVNPSWRRVANPNVIPRHSFGVGTVRDTQLTGSLALVAGGYTGQAWDLGDRRIYASVGGGLIETQYAGGTALTLATNATFAVFHVPNTTLPWAADKLITSLAGSFPSGSIKLEYSLDGGVTYQVVSPGVNETVGVSSTPAVRALRITLRRGGKGAQGVPTLKSLNEIFHEDGGGSFSHEDLVLRFDVPDNFLPFLDGWIYLTDAGEITFEVGDGAGNIAPSTTTKALLLKFTGNGASAPVIKNYTNKRYWHQLRRGTRAAGVTPRIVWDFAAMPHYLKATKVLADGTLKELMDATAFPVALEFDTDITVGGIGTDGDGYRVDVET